MLKIRIAQKIKNDNKKLYIKCYNQNITTYAHMLVQHGELFSNVQSFMFRGKRISSFTKYPNEPTCFGPLTVFVPILYKSDSHS